MVILELHFRFQLEWAKEMNFADGKEVVYNLDRLVFISANHLAGRNQLHIAINHRSNIWTAMHGRAIFFPPFPISVPREDVIKINCDKIKDDEEQQQSQ